MDDNARPHRAGIVEEYLEDHGLERMEWPARSPDLNPIEHLWDYLGREVAALNPPPRSLHELKQGLLCVWSSLPIPVSDNLINSMGNRCRQCIQGYNNILGKLGKRDKIQDIQNALRIADFDGDKKLSYQEVRQQLKARNLSEMEIEMLFAKYDVDGNRELDEKEMQQMFADLEGQKLQLDDEINNQQSMIASDSSRPPTAAVYGRGNGSNVPADEFNVLTRRVDRMEHSIGSIVSKIDAVLVKMEGMEKAKVKRRENMNKILNSISESENLDEKAKRQQMEQLVREELQRWDSDQSLNMRR
ncbi:polycystin-2 [Trichonephila clavipes]|nr:polycystin-2 [Trichonephila clavipes]